MGIAAIITTLTIPFAVVAGYVASLFTSSATIPLVVGFGVFVVLLAVAPLWDEFGGEPRRRRT